MAEKRQNGEYAKHIFTRIILFVTNLRAGLESISFDLNAISVNL